MNVFSVLIFILLLYFILSPKRGLFPLIQHYRRHQGEVPKYIKLLLLVSITLLFADWVYVFMKSIPAGVFVSAILLLSLLIKVIEKLWSEYKNRKVDK